MDNEKELNEIIDKLFEFDHADRPSVDFTVGVLNKIEEVKSGRMAYKPLLPKWFFGLLLVLFAVLILTALFLTEPGPTRMDFSAYLNKGAQFTINTFGALEFSNVMAYMIFTIGVMCCFQAFWLTKRLEARYS